MNNFLELKAQFHKLKNKTLFRNTLWALLAQILKLGIQAVFFIAFARLLGVEQYGAFIGVQALALLIHPYASLGTETLLVKNVARDRALFNKCLGSTIAVTLILGIVIVCLVTAVAGTVFPNSISASVIFTCSLAEIIFTKFIIISSNAFLAIENFKRKAQFDFLFSAKNLVALFMLVVLPLEATLINWSLLYLLLTAIAACICIVTVFLEMGLPKFDWPFLKSEIVSGFYFSVNLSSYMIYENSDKTMLSSISTLESAGIYGAAYRLINIAFSPIQSLLQASFSKFFKHGESGIDESLKYAIKLVRPAVIYGALVAGLIFVISPLIPYVLGSDFQEVSLVLRWLSPLLVFRSLFYFAAHALTGADFHRERTIAQCIFAILNVVLNFVLIPVLSWKGAVISTLVSEGLLTVVFWVISYSKLRASRVCS